MSTDNTGLVGWIDRRFPMSEMWREHLSEYYAPKNFNFWYYFGSLSLLILVNQLLTGIWLAMFYTPGSAGAFNSVAYIMRDVKWGWLLRYMHSTGASFFFIVVYLHMLRALLYGSYRKPRELLWIFGCFIFVALMAEGFTGYVLPWGNMSYWGAQVIISLFGAIPLVGHTLLTWIRGSFALGDPALHRFFALHVVALPFVLVGLVVAHILALHHVGSNNPDGVEIKETKGDNGIPLDGIPFHPYYTVKDIFGVGVFLVLFFGVIFWAPTFHGLFLETANFGPANPVVTPPHITPVWYFTPFYAILRSITFNLLGISAKLWGVMLLAASVAVLFFLPWLDRSPVKSVRYKGWLFKIPLAIFVADVVMLGYLGLQEPSGWVKTAGLVCTIIYFLFFFLMPIYSTFDKTKPVPKRVRE